jgi:basic amino acid/polyamine antiporter, APA family
MLGQNRIFYAMGRDGLLPKWTAHINQKYHTPSYTTWAVGALVAVLAGFMPMKDMSELVSIGTLFAFTMVCAGVVWLRYSHPESPRVFKAPLFPALPIVGVLVNFYLMAGLPKITWVYFVCWTGVGLIVYFLYSIRHSKLR